MGVWGLTSGGGGGIIPERLSEVKYGTHTIFGGVMGVL